MISLVRVDNRLIHGQVVEAWLPHLRVERLAVADDQAASNPLIRAAMGLAVQSHVEVLIDPLEHSPFQRLADDPVKTLILVRDVKDALAAHERGLHFDHLNLGNVHYSQGRHRVSASVFLSEEEVATLKALHARGVEVEARGVPTDKPVSLDEMTDKVAAAN